MTCPTSKDLQYCRRLQFWCMVTRDWVTVVKHIKEAFLSSKVHANGFIQTLVTLVESDPDFIHLRM